MLVVPFELVLYLAPLLVFIPLAHPVCKLKYTQRKSQFGYTANNESSFHRFRLTLALAKALVVHLGCALQRTSHIDTTLAVHIRGRVLLARFDWIAQGGNAFAKEPVHFVDLTP